MHFLCVCFITNLARVEMEELTVFSSLKNNVILYLENKLKLQKFKLKYIYFNILIHLFASKVVTSSNLFYINMCKIIYQCDNNKPVINKTDS